MIKQGISIRVYPWALDHDPERIATAAFKAALAISRENPDSTYTVDVTEGASVVATAWNDPARVCPED